MIGRLGNEQNLDPNMLGLAEEHAQVHWVAAEPIDRIRHKGVDLPRANGFAQSRQPRAQSVAA
jgi:hypothetical protein